MSKRETLRFLVPLSLASLESDDTNDRSIIPLYLSPETISIQEQKIITKDQTKGGFSIQYWGEDLTKITATGTSGSGGIEAIYILRDVYRHEQPQFRNILLERARLFEQTSTAAIESSSSASAGTGVVGALDQILNGAITSISDGITSTIEAVSNAFEGIAGDKTTPVELIPTLGAFAVSIDMYFQGEKFRGYFTDFQVNERSSSPGIFDYTFNFVVLKRFGQRINFMPWHRSPKDVSGNPIQASIPSEGQKLEELSVPYGTSITGNRFDTSTFTVSQASQNLDINNVGVSRLNKVKS